jgi:DNA-binding NarL/FixJ family response regulator
MILCVVDDLMFSMKISTAAKAQKADVRFERSAAAAALDQIRETRPSLVIFDLNSGRMQPVQMIAALKNDPELKAIRTLGFVSHVDSDVIEAARQAGIDEVLARSAFSARLGDILASAS